MVRYKVRFVFGEWGDWHEVILPEGRALADVKDGFWLDEDLQWCAAAKVKYWIPPSVILWVEKINKEGK